ncbi:MAG: ACP S-malonyltransferase [Vampirovibrionales bacterium]
MMLTSSVSPRVVVVFPGQGSQSVGMGGTVFETAHGIQCLQAFQQAVNPIEGIGLSQAMLQGPQEVLNQTQLTQPALAAVSVSLYETLKHHVQTYVPDWNPIAVAGHSLGEYPALYAAGVLSLDTLVTLVSLRGALMQQAPEGAMAAVLGMTATQVQEALTLYRTTAALEPDTVLLLANENTHQQQVIAAQKDILAGACEALKQAGAKRVVPLPVSGAFHSPLMAPSAQSFSETLVGCQYHAPVCPVVMNVTGRAESTPEVLQTLSTQQMTHSVKWLDTMNTLSALRPDVILEVGSGNVLTNMLKKHPALLEACPETQCLALNTPEAVVAWVTETYSVLPVTAGAC